MSNTNLSHAPDAIALSDVAVAVRDGLRGAIKQLPPWLLYDPLGSELFEQITRLPEYYLSRAERSILESQGAAVVEAIAGPSPEPLVLAELGAGTATKTELLLRSVCRRQGAATFLASDMSASALHAARTRLARSMPDVDVRVIVGPHERGLRSIAGLPGRQVVLFIGSSIGNYVDGAATELLRAIRGAVRPGAVLVLGTDLRKDPEALVRAYDDAAGVTAAFNKNVLTRINRELGARFDVERFKHLAVWNDAASRIEMHLESLVEQVVPIHALHLEVRLRRGETIFTEASVKYDDTSVDHLLGSAAFARTHVFHDSEHLFALNVARAI